MEQKYIFLTAVIIGILLYGVYTILDSGDTKHTYSAVIQNCSLTFTNKSCGESIPVETLKMGNTTLKVQDVSLILNSSLCTQLDENHWGCKGYLVTRE